MQLQQAISEFLNGYFSTHHRSDKTRTAYRHDLEQFVGYVGIGVDIDSVSAVTLETWAADLRARNYAPASIRRKLVVLKGFFSYWLRRSELKESPFWRVKLSLGRIEQLPRALTQEEMQKLLIQAGSDSVRLIVRKGAVLSKGIRLLQPLKTYRKLRNLALLDLLFATGMRVGEASALNIDDFIQSEAAFNVNGKGDRQRLAFLVDDESLQIQHRHLEARSQIKATTNALFLNASSQRLSTQGMSKVIAQFRRDAGIERHITPHMLRHTVATLLLRNGADIRIVQEFLGHSSIATTQRYTHIAKDHLICVLKQHHPSLKMRVRA